MKIILVYSKFTMIGAALLLAQAGSALADRTSPSEMVTVFGPYIYSQSPSFGAFHDDGTVSVSRRVSYANLDLTTQTGYDTMHGRVAQAAQDVCHELDKRNPLDAADDRECARTATSNALRDVNTIVADLERATKLASLQ